MNYIKALKQYAPKASYILRGHTYAGLEWLDKVIPKPTPAQLDIAYQESLLVDAKVAYIADRKKEYPPIQDQLDMLWHAMDTGTFPKCSLFYNMIRAVKLKYPKPE